MQARTIRRPLAPPADCGIAEHALVEARLSEIAALREMPGPAGPVRLPPRFLRHCDEHTVVGMHAILRALAARGAEPADVAGHSIVAASCQIGRLAAAKTLTGLATGGGVSVSTHIVPQCSLHSVAGAVSVGLGMHGPHLGVGGGSDALAEGLFAAATIVRAPVAAGSPECVWVVATEWDDEPALDERAAPEGDPLCRGLAVAIEPWRADVEGSDGPADVAVGGRRPLLSRATAAAPLSLTLCLPDGSRPRARPAGARSGRLAAFARALDMCREGTALVSWALECPWGGEIRVSRRFAPVGRRLSPGRVREAA